MLDILRPRVPRLLAIVICVASVSPLTFTRPASAFGRHQGFVGTRFGEFNRGFRPFEERRRVFIGPRVFARPPIVFGPTFFFGSVGGWPGGWVWIPSYWNGWVWVPGRWEWR